MQLLTRLTVPALVCEAVAGFITWDRGWPLLHVRQGLAPLPDVLEDGQRSPAKGQAVCSVSAGAP